MFLLSFFNILRTLSVSFDHLTKEDYNLIEEHAEFVIEYDRYIILVSDCINRQNELIRLGFSDGFMFFRYFWPSRPAHCSFCPNILYLFYFAQVYSSKLAVSTRSCRPRAIFCNSLFCTCIWDLALAARSL